MVVVNVVNMAVRRWMETVWCLKACLYMPKAFNLCLFKLILRTLYISS